MSDGKSIMFEDQEVSIYELVKSDKPVSSLMFPMVTRAIKTGSRAEQVYLESSDCDYIYEVGPAVVGPKFENRKALNGAIILNWEATENSGFYTICDSNDGIVYPVVMQSKVAPIVKRVKSLAKRKKIGAALDETNNTPLNSTGEVIKANKKDEDVVISLKCAKWPSNVWEDFKNREPKLFIDVMTLKEESLYLVPKSHPESKDIWIEWRLSFSMIEIKIMKSLPYIFRKILILCKKLSKDYSNMHRHTTSYITSYILKTVFLWKCEGWRDSGKQYTEDDLFDMILEVFIEIKTQCENKFIPQYFLQQMNLMNFFEKDEKEKVTNPTYLEHFITEQSLRKTICKLEKQFSPFYPLTPAGIFWINGPATLLQQMPAQINESLGVYSPKLFLYVVKPYLKGLESEDHRINTYDNIDLVMEIYFLFLYVLKVLQQSKDQENTGIEEYGIYVLYALKTFSKSFKLSLDSLKNYCKQLSKYYKIDKENQIDLDHDFQGVVNDINSYLSINKDEYIKLVKSDTKSFFHNTLMQDMKQMFDNDTIASLPTPGVYLRHLN